MVPRVVSYVADGMPDYALATTLDETASSFFLIDQELCWPRVD